MKYQYSDTELKSLLSTLTIIVDSRENQNHYITDYFTKKKIPYKVQKLNSADYSAMLPANPELGINRDMYFTDSILLERKHSLDELANNIGQERTRFESELIRAKTKIILMIEGTSYQDIVNHRYKSAYDPKAFLATLHSFSARYGLDINFVPAEFAGLFIWQTALYGVREYLK